MNLRVIVLVFVILIFVLLFCVSGQAVEPARISIDDYNKVVVGSDIRFVYKCLGKQTSISYHDGCEKTLKWEGEEFTVIIRFKHNRVAEKWQSGLSDTD